MGTQSDTQQMSALIKRRSFHVLAFVTLFSFSSHLFCLSFIFSPSFSLHYFDYVTWALFPKMTPFVAGKLSICGNFFMSDESVSQHER